jgi:hypothetical protein
MNEPKRKKLNQATGSEMSEAWAIISDLITGMRIDDPKYAPARDWLNKNRDAQTFQNIERADS